MSGCACEDSMLLAAWSYLVHNELSTEKQRKQTEHKEQTKTPTSSSPPAAQFPLPLPPEEQKDDYKTTQEGEKAPTHPPASSPPAAPAAPSSTPAAPTATCPGRRPAPPGPAGTGPTTGCARCLHGARWDGGQPAQAEGGTSAAQRRLAGLLHCPSAKLSCNNNTVPAMEVPRGAGPGRATTSAAKLRRPAAAADGRPGAWRAAAAAAWCVALGLTAAEAPLVLLAQVLRLSSCCCWWAGCQAARLLPPQPQLAATVACSRAPSCSSFLPLRCMPATVWEWLSLSSARAAGDQRGRRVGGASPAHSVRVQALLRLCDQRKALAVGVTSCGGESKEVW